jgi:hypothetical protein
MPPFAVKTRAEPRVNAYIDEIGLPRPYAKFQPFKPSELGVHLRHFRKPQMPEIQI